MTHLMRSITQHSLGGTDVLAEQQTVRPEPGPGEILVKVHAAGVNPTDWKARASGGLLGEPPFVLGADVSGTVVGRGIGAVWFDIGDEVFGMPLFPRPAAAYAEYVVAPARHFAAKPPELSHVEAAALPLVGLTAWQGLVELAGLRAGQRVLIHAAAGGLGHVAVQVAKSVGAYVIATASAAKLDFVRQLGADEAVDYAREGFESTIDLVDVVLDPIGGDVATRSLPLVQPGGRLVSLIGPWEDDLVPAAEALGVSAGFMLVEADRSGMVELARLVREGRLRPTIGATFPLAEVARAHALGESGGVLGKIVLEVAADEVRC